nr:HD domain-containing protein [Lachnospiraceae bacterium]
PVQEDFYDAADHGELVRLLVLMLCNQMGIEGEEMEICLAAAGIHDIGKLKIGDNLYGRKKSVFHIEEVKYMRMHAEIAKEMLEECNYPKKVIEAVYHHHENYDGSGYPNNLQGENIPRSARILRICDAFAALISDRPYRKAFDMDTALSMMTDDIRFYDVSIFLDFMKIYNSDDFTKAIELAKQINEKHHYEIA